MGAPGRTSWMRVPTANISAFCRTSAPARVAGAIAPASVNGVTHTAWPAPASSISPSAIGISSVSGVLVLTMVSSAGRSARPSRSVPRAMAAISMQSDARSRPSAMPCQFLSSSRIREWQRSRWRVSGARSIASKGPPPSCWMMSSACTRRRYSICSAWVPGRRPRSTSLANAGPPTEVKTTLRPPIVRSRVGFRARNVNDDGASATIDSTNSGSKRTIRSSTTHPAPAKIRRACGCSTRMPVDCSSPSDDR